MHVTLLREVIFTAGVVFDNQQARHGPVSRNR